jgi:hypothetical protein
VTMLPPATASARPPDDGAREVSRRSGRTPVWNCAYALTLCYASMGWVYVLTL